MNPVELTRNLENALVSYLTTTFNVNRDGSEAELASAIEAGFRIPGALFNGPHLEIAPPYKLGETLEKLVEEKVLSPRLLRLDCFQERKPIPIDVPLYAHQERAIRNLCVENRSTVISSGTGSGKTECFLIPILNDLLIDPTPGVRALLIYPMNALVNDQLDRLRGLLKGTNITFGRYTSELAETRKQALETNRNPLPNEVIAREEIRSGEKLPQILITNYAMLEFLLLRPEDSILFQNGKWRFIILDEAHTYMGAQGIEVSFLLRRLKHRLNRQPGDTLCVATSATLTSDDANKAAEFAQRLFDESISPEDVIFGVSDKEYATIDEIQEELSVEAYINPRFNELLSMLRNEEPLDTDALALKLVELQLLRDADLQIADAYTGKPLQFLWYILSKNPRLKRLREWMLERADNPATLGEAAAEIFPDLDEDARLQAIYHLTELGFLTREAPDKHPLLPARYHLFARPPQGVWVCLNANCSGRQSSSQEYWSRLFGVRRDTCDACGCAVYPLYICRACGQAYVQMVKLEREYLSEATIFMGDIEKNYFTWKPLHQKGELFEDSEEFEPAPEDEEETASSGLHEKFMLCLNCRNRLDHCRCNQPSFVVLYQMREEEKTKKGQQTFTKFVPITHMNQCCRCHSTALKDTEIVTPISLAGMTPLSLLTNELYRRLPSSPRSEMSSIPGNGRKLLTFYDSRQGAARFAAFLQDIVNQQTYRHIMPKAVEELQKRKSFFPDLEMLAKRCMELGVENEVFHNDAYDIRRGVRLTQSERERLTASISTQLLAEFTTQRRDRHSLENLGLVAVEYFESDEIPDFGVLADQIGFSEPQTRMLIEYLLDDLRREKVVALPEGVEADNPIFGRNKFSPRVVRGKAHEHEVAWIGETERHSRRLKVQAILQHYKMPADDRTIQQVLGSLWDWLTNSDILDGNPTDGYQIAHQRLFFHVDAQWYRCQKCQRLSYRGDSLPCSNVSCLGELLPVEITSLQENNFYYQSLNQSLIPMRVEEHTAQLDSIKGREYQDQFRDGRINVLSCSTTFEMGIDLGDLQAVVMSNVPPTVANYRQRAGRAGRRASGIAFILTWASERPHDQTYFRAPGEIIRGHMPVPHIALENPFILKRHVNAILLSAYLRYRREAGHTNLSTVGDFFDAQSTQQPHYDGIEKWLELRSDHIRQLLSNFADAIDQEIDINEWLVGFWGDMQHVKNNDYDKVANYYRQERIAASQVSATSNQASEQHTASQDIQRYIQLLERLNKETLINYLSDKGILPSYSFPLYTVELILPPAKDTEHLRLQRDLRQAIREYAPGSEVVADKRIWRSDGLIFYRDTPLTREYRICEHCNHLQITLEGMSFLNDQVECPICRQMPSKKRAKAFKFVTPDGFRADYHSGQAARQFVNIEPSAMRSALIPPQIEEEYRLGHLVRYAYDHNGQLLYVNEGEGSFRFKICMKCGKRIKNKEGKCTGRFRGEKCPGGHVEEVALGHVQKTDTLHLSFESTSHFSVPAADNQSFWLSLMYALLQGASRALQIERRDIDGVLLPRSRETQAWEQTIVLYDNVPGGAGHVKRIHDHFAEVVQEALRIVNCLDCAPETSCYHCLRDYSNQLHHHLLKRGDVVRFLETIHKDLTPFTQLDTVGEGFVIAMNPPYWLMQQVLATKSHISLAAERLTLDQPVSSGQTWIDAIGDLVRRGVKVNLYVCDLRKDTPEDLSINLQLQILMDRGLQLWQIESLPEWQVIIDEKLAEQRAIRVPADSRFVLNAVLGDGKLLSTIHPDGVSSATLAFHKIPNHQIKREWLNPPNDTIVITVQPHTHRNYTETDFFAAVFAKTVVGLHINDPYLLTNEQIVNRLGAYITLASQQGGLKRVVVVTKRAGEAGTQGDRSEQDRAKQALIKQFSHVEITFKYDRPEHDRYIILHREDKSRARILIGRGLDFIKPNGDVLPTFIVVQDPF